MYPIPPSYAYLENRWCWSKAIKSFTSLQEAKDACNLEKYCGCIQDWLCDGSPYTIHEHSTFSSSTGTCAWLKCK